VTDLRFTHIGGPIALITVDGWHLLIDPTCDDPGRRDAFGRGTSSRKLAGPAIAAADLPPIDAVLLTHDHHDSLHERHHRRARDAYGPDAVDRAAIVLPPAQQSDAA
jgi:L-ascorbate metabolism protein UlaG (beta-lactamase superfamily)